MKTADPVVESSLKQTSKLVNKKQLEVKDGSLWKTGGIQG